MCDHDNTSDPQIMSIETLKPSMSCINLYLGKTHQILSTKFPHPAPIACRIPNPVHDSCTDCIVGVVRALCEAPTWSLEHPHVLLLGPSGCLQVHRKDLNQKSKVPSMNFIYSTSGRAVYRCSKHPHWCSI